MALSSEERVALVRTGNERWNAGDVDGARACFLRAHYTDGMLRCADWYYDQKKPVLALLLYRKCGATTRCEELYARMAAVIRTLLAQDEPAAARAGAVPVPLAVQPPGPVVPPVPSSAPRVAAGQGEGPGQAGSAGPAVFRPVRWVAPRVVPTFPGDAETRR